MALTIIYSKVLMSDKALLSSRVTYVGCGLELGRHEEQHEHEAKGAHEADDLCAPARLVLHEAARERRAAALAAEERAEHIRAAERDELLHEACTDAELPV